jgi:hypothetical protein
MMPSQRIACGAMMTRGERRYGKRPKMASEEGFFPLLFAAVLSETGGEEWETHRGPGDLAEHLDVVRELLNWRRKGRTRQRRFGGRMETG